jgi:hypothetical protein
MPLRAFGYLASAAHIANEYLPNAQVQMVHTLHAAQRVNGVNIEQARKGAEHFARLGTLMLAGSGVSTERVTFLVDPLEPADIDEDAVRAALETAPADVRDKLLASGSRRGSDTIPYVAAHLQMHDTAAGLAPLRHADEAPIEPTRIISLGAQSERPFYLARMACREQDVVIPDRITDTAQLFTRHVLPPYQFTKQGSEPHMQELLAAEPFRSPLEWAADPFAAAPENLSAARDLTYLQTYIGQGAFEHA